jgi:hypothetical protein
MDMTEVKHFDLPTMAKDGPGAVENKYCEILNLRRNGNEVPSEVLDWMDSANTWLIKADNFQQKVYDANF